MFRKDPDAARREVIETLELAQGKLARAAHFLNISRRQFYKIIYREELWDEVDRIRQQRQREEQEPEWLKRTREELRS